MVPAVLIVEDDPRCSSAFADAVRAAPDLRLAGVAGDVAEGLRLLDDLRPDVLLVDIGLPSGSGIELIRHAHARLPQCETMVVTVFADDRAVLGCIEAGATGYLLKDSRSVDIAQEIRLLCGGGSPISPAIARRLLARMGGRQAMPIAAGRAPAEVASAVNLSVQERSVLTYSAKGYSFDETARLMGLSGHTVETYVKRIYRKLQVHSKTEAVYEGRRLGLVRD
jgi:DNA-binding NarL/FixJ family response regulator